MLLFSRGEEDVLRKRLRCRRRGKKKKKRISGEGAGRYLYTSSEEIGIFPAPKYISSHLLNGGKERGREARSHPKCLNYPRVWR